MVRTRKKERKEDEDVEIKRGETSFDVGRRRNSDEERRKRNPGGDIKSNQKKGEREREREEVISFNKSSSSLKTL